MIAALLLLLTQPVLSGTVSRDRVEDGVHWRIWTPAGAVHVWRPSGYQEESAGTLVYLHGYFIHADRAFDEHRLAAQFRQSRQNALFVVPEAPAGKAEPIAYPELGALLRLVERSIRRKIPDGPLVVLAHSGAYRTVAGWLAYRRLDELILLDALYAKENQFADWLAKDPRHQAHKLVLVSIETAARSEDLLERFPMARRGLKVPPRLEALSPGQRRAQLLYLPSQYDHFALVTSGEVLPVLLALTPFRRL